MIGLEAILVYMSFTKVVLENIWGQPLTTFIAH